MQQTKAALLTHRLIMARTHMDSKVPQSRSAVQVSSLRAVGPRQLEGGGRNERKHECSAHCHITPTSCVSVVRKRTVFPQSSKSSGPERCLVIHKRVNRLFAFFPVAITQIIRPHTIRCFVSTDYHVEFYRKTKI